MTPCILVDVHQRFTKSSCLHVTIRHHVREDNNHYSHRTRSLTFHKREFPCTIYVVITEVSKLHFSFHGLCFPRTSAVLSYNAAVIFRLQGTGHRNPSIYRTDLLPCYSTAVDRVA